MVNRGEKVGRENAVTKTGVETRPVGAGNSERAGRSAAALEPGDRATLTREVTEVELALFGAATGDTNPIHFDPDYARSTRFRGPIAHGLLAAGLISAVIANQLPGLGTVYVSQDLRFLAPVRIGDRVTAEVEVLAVDRERNRARLRTSCVTQEGIVVVDGEATVMPPLVPLDPVGQGPLQERQREVEGRLRGATAAFREAFLG
ncbi:MAG: MaoC family dehydratase [Deltaproteobacteria bacterium]|nr:MaoC family dehydratase [Deltaproteobacteria bacterium]